MSDILNTINEKGGIAAFSLLQWANTLPVDVYTLTKPQWQAFTSHPSVRLNEVFDSVNWEYKFVKIKSSTIFEMEQL